MLASMLCSNINRILLSPPPPFTPISSDVLPCLMHILICPCAQKQMDRRQCWSCRWISFFFRIFFSFLWWNRTQLKSEITIKLIKLNKLNKYCVDVWDVTIIEETFLRDVWTATTHCCCRLKKNRLGLLVHCADDDAVPCHTSTSA